MNKKKLTAALVGAIVLMGSVADARVVVRGNPPGPRGGPGAGARVIVRPNNPPGPRGGPGTNWWLGNPPGPAGGPGAGPRWRNRVIPAAWVYWGIHEGHHWYKHPGGYWCVFDNDGNPPGPAGGPGTNWENPPGPIGGPGASPDSPNRPC